MSVKIPKHLEKQREVKVTKEELISFETEVKEKYEGGEIPAPIHLAKNNEEELIEIFQYIHTDDWVFQAWRNHYHALLHGFDRQRLMDDIVEGRSMATSDNVSKFYSCAIVGGVIPIALETGVFHESYKYARNFDLPIEFVVEDNNLSVHTPTDAAWGKHQDVPDDVVYYKFENEYPHHGTGAWVNF